MNNPDPTNPQHLQPESKVRPGYDAQAEGLAMLRHALDRYSSQIETAKSSSVDASASAVHNRDRLIESANQRLADTLEAIRAKKDEAQVNLDNKYGPRLQDLTKEYEMTVSTLRGMLKRDLGKAKKELEERVWLADTVLESSLRKADIDYQAMQKQIVDQAKAVENQLAELAQELGPSKFAEVIETKNSNTQAFEDPTVDGLKSIIDKISDALVALKKGGALKIFRGRKQTVALALEVRESIIEAQAYTKALEQTAEAHYDQRVMDIESTHRDEVIKSDSTYRESAHALEIKIGQQVKAEHEQYLGRSQEVRKRRENDAAEIQVWEQKQLELAHTKHTEQCESAKNDCVDLVEDASETYRAEFVSGRARLLQAVGSSLGNLKLTHDQILRTNLDWPLTADSAQPTEVPKVIALAQGQLDLAPRLNRVAESIRAELGLPETVRTPIAWSLPGDRSFLIRHDGAGRNTALATIRNSILRILASFPAGKVRFMLADPIGIGQSFAEFMVLSDQEPSQVGQRIWSDPQQIERQLSDITEHMQTVIQKYLRADYETIEDYNKAAGEISEPYRFVVIADLPEALTEIGAARLKSILESGPRCGVYAMFTADASSKLPPSLEPETIRSNSVVMSIENGIASLADDRFDETDITLEGEPDDRVAARVLERVRKAGAEAGTVEVPFNRLAPDVEDIWSRSCDDELVIPIGRLGAQKNQELRLGMGTRQHALIAGRTGSGKSTLLHVIITAAMLWHSPDELELYLIDFKKGVEFKAYTGQRVPHVRAVAIESDREFGLSVLKRLDDELTSRGELFRRIGAQNLASARAMSPDERLPRVLLLIDEFQEFFTEDDDVASEATLLLDRLVRQGRAFGVHVILGSQTLAGSYSLARSTLGQIGVRIALQCSEADSYLILGEDNNAARLLERPGEAIYNNAGGLVEGNSPFQTAWLADAQRDRYIDSMPLESEARPDVVVFEGNKPAQFDVSAKFFAQTYPDRKTPRVLLGDAVAIAPPTSAPLLKRSGSNLLILGQQPEPSLGMLVSAAIAAGSARGARVVVIDPTPEDDAMYGRIGDAITATGIDARIETHKEADQVVAEMSKMVQDRNDVAGDPVILVLAGIHRLRSLRKSDDFSFSMDETQASPDKDLINILREGPAVGVWTLAWCDTLSNVERAMERTTIREFGLRALMQMSASDSASLIDTSVASTLGTNRAILADDVEGTLQKFRPINLPDARSAAMAWQILTD